MSDIHRYILKQLTGTKNHGRVWGVCVVVGRKPGAFQDVWIQCPDQRYSLEPWSGNSQRMIAWQQELIWWFGFRYEDPHLANPTPRLAPLLSRRMRVETTCPKDFSMASNSCSSMVSGRLEMYRLVGSCSCCCWECDREKKRQKL